MLVVFLFDLFYKFTVMLINMIPDFDVPNNLINLLAPVANFVGYIDTFISLPVLLSCMAFILLVDNWNLIVRILMQLWEMIPFN